METTGRSRREGIAAFKKRELNSPDVKPQTTEAERPAMVATHPSGLICTSASDANSLGPITANRDINVIDSDSTVVGSHFGIESIVKVIRFVLEGSISMRAASRILGIINNIASCNPFEYPSHTTVQNCILRLGLFLLQRNSQHEDWIWIADHTYSVGTMKVLVVLGIRLSTFISLDRPLQYQDLSVLLMLSVESSNGAVVEQQFTKLAEKTGKPLAILSDAGSDLTKGTALFQAKHEDVVGLYDIVHLASRKIEQIMKADESWDKFRKSCCTCANLVRQSNLAHLKPPRPRTKARYMNIDREVTWGARAIQVLDLVRAGKMKAHQEKRLPRELVEAKLCWLDEYRDSIKQWELLSLAGRQVISEVRRCGYGDAAETAVKKLLDVTTNPTCRQLIEDIASVIQPMNTAASQYGHLPSSSEILESLFGKGKRLLSGTSAGTTNSLTSQLLAMVACTTQVVPSLIRTALETCRIKHLREWSKETFGNGINHMRSLDLPPTPEEQKLRTPKPESTPNF